MVVGLGIWAGMILLVFIGFFVLLFWALFGPLGIAVIILFFAVLFNA